MVRRRSGNGVRLDPIHVGLATVAMAVTASSAFPGFFPPLEELSIGDTRPYLGIVLDDGVEAVGEAKIVPVLFKHAKELTRTFGGNVDDPLIQRPEGDDDGWMATSKPGT
jgi:hypothetical protein